MYFFVGTFICYISASLINIKKYKKNKSGNSKLLKFLPPIVICTYGIAFNYFTKGKIDEEFTLAVSIYIPIIVIMAICFS